MKRNKGFFGVLIIALSSLLILQLETSARRGSRVTRKKYPQARSAEKIRYKNYVWIEGENATSTNFSKEKTYNFFCSNRFALQLSKEADPVTERGYYANYVFYIPKSKSYDMWFACTPPGSRYSGKPGYASPVEWKIDDGSFRIASSENTFVKKAYGVGGFYWVKVSRGDLGAGRHTLTVRVKQKRASGWDYFFYIDAILFIPTYSGYLNSMMEFPEIAPRAFDERGTGIRFEKIDYYKNRLKKNPRDRNTLFTLAQIYQWLYEYDKAIDLYRRIIERDRKNITARIMLASNLSWADRLDRAIAEYKNIIAIDRNNITARKLLAVLAGWNNRYDEAIRNYQEIIKIDPENVDAYISLATQYSWTGKPNRALEIFRRAERIAPRNVQVLYALGDNYYWVGKTYQSIRQFKKIISIDEREIEAYKKLARIYLEQGQISKSSRIMEDAKRIVMLNPELSAFSMDVKGEMERERIETISEYRQSLLKNPDDLGIRKNLVDAYIWNKMHDEAASEYNNILNYRLLKTVENSEEKLASLLLELIKLYGIIPVVESIERSYEDMNEYYAGIHERLKGGGEVPDELTRERLNSDGARISLLAQKNDTFEQNLARFLDIMSLHNREVRSYEAQRAALRWEFDYSRIISKTEKTKVMNPKDYRPSKLLGTLHCWFADRKRAVDEMARVFKMEPRSAVLGYPVALMRVSQYERLRQILGEIEKKNLLRGASRRELTAIGNFWTVLGRPDGGKAGELTDDGSSALRVSERAIREYRRFRELKSEWLKYLQRGEYTVRKVFEKSFLELENSNVGIYNEIANYHLNNDQMLQALEQYYNILSVQPLNVDINYKLGNMNEALDYWYSAMKNYELCIDNQSTNDLARKSHYGLQTRYAPSVNSDTEFYSDEFVTRVRESLYGIYNLNDWFSFKAGYRFYKIDDEISQGSVSLGGVQYFPSKGSVMQHSAFLNAQFKIVPLGMTVYFDGSGNQYSGKVEYEDSGFNSVDVNYFTMNYGGGLIFSPAGIGFSLQLGYRHEDVTELTKAIADEITSNTFMGIMDISLENLAYPVINRFFLYNSFHYKSLSDSNTRMSSYNQLSYRLLKFPSVGINFDLYGIYTYEQSDFTEYDKPVGINNTPYWAPDKLYSYGGGAAWRHSIKNVYGGILNYDLFFQYSRADIDEDTMSPGIKLGYQGAHLEFFASYYYSRTIPSTEYEENPKPFISHSGRFGLQYKFFTIYQPHRLGGKPVILITATPTLITADGDGRDDYTTFSFTAFDKKGIANWELEILNEKGEKVKSFNRTGSPPANLRWDGADKANNLLPSGTYRYRLSIVNSARERRSSKEGSLYLARKKRAITLEASYETFSPNDDGVRDTVGIELKATEKERVNSWVLSIRDKNKRMVRKISGFDFIPYDTQWDGRDDRGRLLGDGNYELSVNVRYADGETIYSPPMAINIRNKSWVDLQLDRRSIIPMNKVSMRATAPFRDVEQWKVWIKSADNTVLRVLNGSGTIPNSISWDGTDAGKNVVGYNLPLRIQVEVQDFAGNRVKSKEMDLFLGFLTREQGGKRIVYVFNQGLLHRGKTEAFTEIGLQIIDQLIAFLKSSGVGRKIEIVSHTSTDGSRDNNKALSLRRAEKLADLFRGKGKMRNVSYTPGGEEFTFKKGEESKWDSRYEIVIY